MAPMPITLVTGPANAGKAGVVLDSLRAHHARGEQPLLVVPTRADVEQYRRELAYWGPVVGVRVERFEGLLAEVLRRAAARGSAGADRPLGRIARERVLAAVLARVRSTGSGAADVRSAGPGAGRAWSAGSGAESGRSSPGEAAPGAVRALAALVGELEVARVTPARLREALEAWVAADPAQALRARELGQLFEEYRRALEELRPTPRADPERRAVRALDALRRAPALWGSTPVLLYGFDDLTALQLDAIETLGAVVGAPVTVSLAYEPGRTAFAGRGDTFQRLLPLASEHRRLEPRAEYYAPRARCALHHLERHLFEPDRPPAVSAGEAVRLLEGGGERAELELIAEEIGGLLQRGMRPAEIAVAHRSPATIAPLLGEVFRARGIPYALERRLPFAHSAIGRGLLGLLGAAFEDGEGGLGDLLAWLRTPGVLRRPEWADELERQARRAGVGTTAQARALWEAEHWPLEALDWLRDAAAPPARPAALIEHTASELERLFCAPRLHAEPLLAPTELQEACALAAGRAALEELQELARSAPALAPGASELIATLRELEFAIEAPPPGALGAIGADPSGASGAFEAPPPAAVSVLDPLALRARRVRALFLCGLQEGVFPAPPRPEPLLSDEERRGLAEASGLRLRRAVDALAAERYLLYAAVSRSEELLVLSWHTADDDGLPSARSLFVDDVCDLFACDLHEARTRRALGEVSPRAPTGAPPGGIAPLRDPRVLADLRGQRLWSASGLQSWAGCPVRWFVERLLGASGLDPDAEPLARGGLAHAALRETFAGLRLQTGSARLRPELLPQARKLLRAALERHAEEYPLSTAPERVPGVRRRLEADLERYLEHAAQCEERGESPLEPTYLELPFGFPAGAVAQPADPALRAVCPGVEPAAPEELPALDLGEGVLVRGVIDRVDLAPGGEAVVYDYKSAYTTPPDRWLGERSFQIALYMRAVEELLGARAVGGFYQPLAGRDLRARGVLAEGEGVELHCVRGDARPLAEVRELVGEVLTAAREAGVQARAGALKARPGTCGFGNGGCAYPSICRCER
jgi:hypothetical protein